MRRKKLPRTLATPSDEGASSRDANIVENLVSLFAPDVLLGCDYEIAYCGRERAPEEELMATVLEQTVADFQRYFLSQDEKGRRYFLAAEEWFSKDDSDWGVFFHQLLRRSWHRARLFPPRLGALAAKQRR